MSRYVQSQSNGFSSLLQGRGLRRGLLWGSMIIGALLAFEMFNFSTTEFALHDLLGDLSFAGVRWATILALAFCGIDFAGIARLFTPEEGADEPAEVWYLFGAWLLAATMNAMLTWWGISIAILNHQTLGNAVVAREVLLEVVPIFVAVMVWLSRVLIIGTFSIAGDRLFSQSDRRRPHIFSRPGMGKAPAARPQTAFAKPAFKPTPKPVNRPNSIYNAPEEPVYNPRPEPSYHPVSAAPRAEGSETSQPARAPFRPKNFQ
ncbi:MAG TPA: hypothetical protein VMN57_08415 [Anaerolineales bacterium]|nr:hypothetical protein [Anaerolineales bacterium]